MTEGRSQGFAARYLILFGGEAFSKVCVLLAFAYLARVLSPSSYGTVELALSVTMFFVLGVESGMGSYGARMVAAHPEGTPALIPRIAALRVLLGIPAYIAIVTVAAYSRSAGLGVLAVNGVAVLLTPFLTQWVFQGMRRMQWVAAGAALRNIVFVALIVSLVRPGSDIRLVALSEVGGIAVLAAFNAWVLRRLGVGLDWRGLGEGVRGVFAQVWSLGVSDFTWACIWYAPGILLGWAGGTAQVAWIAASVRIVNALHTFVFLYFFNLLPNLAAELTVDVAHWRALVERSLRTAMWPAILLAVGGTLIAPEGIVRFYGAEFASAVLPFQIVIWMIPVAWFSGHSRFSLVAAGRQRWELLAATGGALAVVAVGGVLARLYGAPGAAAALLIGGLVNGGLALVFSWRQIGSIGVVSSVGAPAAAGLVAVSLGLALRGAVGVIPSTTIACALFVIAAVAGSREVRSVIPFAPFRSA